MLKANNSQYSNQKANAKQDKHVKKKDKEKESN